MDDKILSTIFQEELLELDDAREYIEQILHMLRGDKKNLSSYIGKFHSVLQIIQNYLDMLNRRKSSIVGQERKLEELLDLVGSMQGRRKKDG